MSRIGELILIEVINNVGKRVVLMMLEMIVRLRVHRGRGRDI